VHLMCTVIQAKIPIMLTISHALLRGRQEAARLTPQQETLMLRNRFSIFVVLAVSGCSSVESDVAPVIIPVIEDHEAQAVVADSPFDKPWPTSFTQKEVSDKALEEAYELYEANKTPERIDELTVYEESTVPDGYRECAETSATRILYAFEDFIPEDFISKDHSLVIGTSPEWVANTVVSTGADLPNQESANGATQAYEDWLLIAFTEGRIFGIAEDIVVILGTDTYRDCQFMGFFAAHETFHMIHSSIDNRSLMNVKPGIDKRMAAWFYEGSAQFFSFSIESFYEEPEYVSPSFVNEPGGLKSHEPLDAPFSLYVYGHAAIEYLVANVGVESVMQVFKNVGDGDNFDVAFEKAIGMPLANFYILFDSLKISPS
jgi:hypothetical protein